MGNLVAVQRRYKLLLLGNKGKNQIALYAHNRFNLFVRMFMARVFFGQDRFSTAGMGVMANQAKYKCSCIVRALRQSSRATGNKMNVPQNPNVGFYATITPSKNSFSYWITCPNLWKKYSMVRIPAKSHKALNGALKDGWVMSNLCEVKPINGNLYALVSLKKYVPRQRKVKTFLGCDVGIRNSVNFSDGYHGRGLSRIIKKDKVRKAERRRQGQKVSSKVKTNIKQILDREAKVMLRRSKMLRAGIAVESPKRLANLRSGRLQGWARSYFQNRVEVLGKEEGISVIGVSPYQTSITCSKCLNRDSENRSGKIFNCKACGHIEHADINAAKNIARLASEQQSGKFSDFKESV